MVAIELEMDLAQPSVIPAIRMVQGDEGGRVLVITLLENVVAYTVPDGTTGIVRFLKPDKTGGSYDTLPDSSAACSFSGNVLTVNLASQVLTVPGIVRLTVDLVNGSEHLHTFTVKIDVEANPGYQATSEGYFNLRGALADSGWPANKYLGTDLLGNVVAKDAPEGTGGDGGTGIAYYDLDLVSAGITVALTTDSAQDISSVISGEEVLALIEAGVGIRVIFQDTNKELTVAVPLTASYDRVTDVDGSSAAYLGSTYVNPFLNSHSEMLLDVDYSGGEYTVTLKNFTDFYAQLQTDVAALQEAVEKNTDAIDAIPVTVDDNGYTVVSGQARATKVAAVRTDTETTITITMQGGESITGVLAYDENGLPVSYTENDLEMALELTGFDDLVIQAWEGGSY